jgi:signal transduction histidine kinase/CheY-like chemotaxis protein
MRLLKNTFVLNLLVILALGGAGFFSYQAFESYQKLQEYQKEADLSAFLQKLSTLSDIVDNEMLESTSYLIKKSKIRLKKMLQARERTDTALQRLSTQIETEAVLYPLQNRIILLSEALHQARRKIDALPEHITESLFSFYHLGVSIPLAEAAGSLALLSPFQKNTPLLLLSQKILTLKANTAFENSMVFALLLQKHPLSSKEKQILEQIEAKDSLPAYETYLNEASRAHFHTVLPEETYRAYLQNMRTLIKEGAKDGKYGIDIVAWLEQVKKKQAALTKLENDMRTTIMVKSSGSYFRALLPSVIYLLTALLLLFMMVKLILLRSAQIKNRKLYDDTLREIKLVFDQEEQKKMKRLVEQGNIDLIYRFLLQAIKDANHTKDLFLANMSHEIRTPLNGIVGFTQLLQETETTEEQKEFLTIVAKSSEHLLKIVNDILDLAKIKAQKIEFESITFDPLEAFETAIESYAGKAFKENIDLYVFIDPSLPKHLIGDPTKISQILVNLLSNAVKFTPKNGEVHVRIEKRVETDTTTEIYFAVSDTGIGITKEQRKKIFEAFSQADVSTSRKYGGTGLGLSISGRLIDLLGGKLGIRSIPHEGSTFHFTLSLQKATKSEKREIENLEGLHVGILDPHIELQYYPNHNLAAYLTFCKAKVIHYTERSLIAAKENGSLPDILFIDHKFRQREGELEPFLTLETQIILLTTSDQKRVLQRHKDKIDKILYKPVTFNKTQKVLSSVEDEQVDKKEIYFKDLHVLVAEDNHINQQLITRVLNNIGVEVTIANNGKEALEYRKSTPFDMILMDIEMPIMGGMEATAKILGYERAEHKTHIPIIALTANALSGDRAKYMGAGMDGYLSKPIGLEALNTLLLDFFAHKESKKNPAD